MHWLSPGCSESLRTYGWLCMQTIIALCVPQGIYLLGGTGTDELCCDRMRESGCDSSSSAVLSHVRAGTSSVQEHAWLSRLT